MTHTERIGLVDSERRPALTAHDGVVLCTRGGQGGEGGGGTAILRMGGDLGECPVTTSAATRFTVPNQNSKMVVVMTNSRFPRFHRGQMGGETDRCSTQSRLWSRPT